MSKRRLIGLIIRVIFFFIIVAIFYYAVYCPLSRVTGALG